MSRIHLILFYYLFAIPGMLLSQQQGQRTFPAERIIPLNNGYLGMIREGSVSQFTWYSAQFKELSSVAVEGVIIQEILPVVLDTAGKAGVLVLGSGSGTVLLRLDVGPALTLNRLWAADSVQLRSMAVDKTAMPGTIAMFGDSCLVLAGINGVERLRVPGYFVSAVFGNGLTAFRRVNSGLEVLRYDSVKTLPAAILLLENARSVRVVTQPDAVNTASAGYLLTDAGGGYSFRLAGNTAKGTGHTISLPFHPRGVFAVPGVDGPFVVFRRSAGKLMYRFLSPDQDSSEEALYYPLDQAPDTVLAVTGRLPAVVVLADDSAVVYTSGLQLKESFRCGAWSRDVSVFRTDSAGILVSSSAGSVYYKLGRNEYTWFDKNSRLIAVSGGGFLALLLAAWFLVRYRFRDIVYQTLVRVPSSNGVMILTGKGRVRYVNPSARDLLGIAAVIPLGRNIAEYLIGDQLKDVVNDTRHLYATGQGYERRAEVQNDGRHFSFLFRGRPMIGRFGVSGGYLITVEDITRTLEKERLVNWASVAHHIAHEMKTPLGTIRLTAENLRLSLTGRAASPDVIRGIERIVGQSDRLRSIVNDLMTVARAENLKRHLVDVALAMKGLADEFMEYIPESARVLFEQAGDDFHCSIDLEQFTVAVRNLMDNAVQAVGARAGGFIKLSLSSTAEKLNVVISDNGIGMSPATLSNVFQPFYTEREGGSGIGSVLAKQIVEAHGGHITVVSVLNVGTTFTIEIPRD